MKFLDKLRNSDSLLSFLILECIAITSFALGNYNVLFYLLGIFIALFAIAITYNRFNKEELKSMLTLAAPMLLLAVFSSFGLLLQADILNNILSFLAIFSFIYLGIASRKIEGFSPWTLLIVLGAGLSLVTIISMIATWANYGWFYAAIYKNTPIYYYNAELFDVTKESTWLVGFKFKDTSTAYTGLYGILLTSYLGGLLFINPKKDPRHFFIVLGIGLVGLLSIITVPNIPALVLLVPTILVAVCYRFFKDNLKFRKVLKYGTFVFVGLVLIFFVLVLFNAAQIGGLSNFLASNKVLNRIFNGNRVMFPINQVLSQALKSYNLFGYAPSSVHLETIDVISVNSKMFAMELVKQGGIFTVIFLVAFILIFGYIFVTYLNKSKDDHALKMIFFLFLVSFLVYQAFNYEAFPYVHDANQYIGFFRHPLTLIMLFIVGFTFYPLSGEVKEKEKQVEQTKEPAKKIKDEYSFEDSEGELTI